MSESASPLLKPALIFVGAGAGGVLRHWLSGWVQALAGPAFPLGTVVVNITGCFAVGMLAAIFAGPGVAREEFRAAVLIGVLGGYTTFSAFGRETIAMAAEGRWGAAGLNVLLSNVLGLAGVWAGNAAAIKWRGAGTP